MCYHHITQESALSLRATSHNNAAHFTQIQQEIRALDRLDEVTNDELLDSIVVPLSQSRQRRPSQVRQYLSTVCVMCKLLLDRLGEAMSLPRCLD